MSKTRLMIAASALLVLVGCGTPETNTAVNEAVATATALVPAGAEATVAAALEDPAVEEAVSAVAGIAEDPAVQSALDEAFNSINDQMTLTQGENLSFDAFSGLADITNLKLTIVDAPAGAEASENQVIKEASNGNVSLTPEEYGKYFTTAGDYKVRADVVSSGNKTASHEFTITVP